MMQKASSSLSRMVYRDNCTGNELVTYTSPLAGTTRDPRGVCGDAVHPLRTEWLERGVQPNHAGSDLYSKEYILLDPSYLARVRRSLAPPPAAGTHPRNRAFLFDCGATTWGDGRGLAWLVNRYRDAGIEFDHIFGWEVKEYRGKTFFEGMPGDVIGKMHFYNFPMSAVPGDASNPLTLLRSVALPGDFVVIKLDIDTPQVEIPLIEQLDVDPALRALVDMFFFEHHIELSDMLPHWGPNVADTMSDSIDLFTRLRREGINAQVWI